MALSWMKSQMPEQDVNHELLLNLASGAPLAAQQLINDDMFKVRQELFHTLYSLSKNQEDPLKSAARLYNHEPLRLLDFLLSWTMDLLRLQLDGSVNAIINTDYANQLQELKQKMHVTKITKLMDYLQKLRAQACMGINFNKQLMLEGIIIRWMECHTCS